MKRITALALVLSFVALACGGDDAADGGSSPLTTTTAASSATTVATTTTTEAPAVTQDPNLEAADGDFVEVHYRGTLDDGSEFDSSAGRDPLAFVVGSGQVIAGFDEAVRGLKVGDSVTVTIEPADAYGEVREDLVFDLSLEGAPEGLGVGDQVTLTNGLRVTILSVDEEANSATVDGNHQLAGKALTFDIEVVSIERP